MNEVIASLRITSALALARSAKELSNEVIEDLVAALELGEYADSGQSARLLSKRFNPTIAKRLFSFCVLSDVSDSAACVAAFILGQHTGPSVRRKLFRLSKTSRRYRLLYTWYQRGARGELYTYGTAGTQEVAAMTGTHLFHGTTRLSDVVADGFLVPPADSWHNVVFFSDWMPWCFSAYDSTKDSGTWSVLAWRANEMIERQRCEKRPPRWAYFDSPDTPEFLIPYPPVELGIVDAVIVQTGSQANEQRWIRYHLPGVRVVRALDEQPLVAGGDDENIEETLGLYALFEQCVNLNAHRAKAQFDGIRMAWRAVGPKQPPLAVPKSEQQLQRIRRESLRKIKRAIVDPNRANVSLQLSRIRLLGKLRWKGAYEFLAELINGQHRLPRKGASEDDVKTTCFRALGQLGDERATQLVAHFLDDGNQPLQLRQVAIESLGQLDTLRSVQVLHHVRQKLELDQALLEPVDDRHHAKQLTCDSVDDTEGDARNALLTCYNAFVRGSADGSLITLLCSSHEVACCLLATTTEPGIEKAPPWPGRGELQMVACRIAISSERFLKPTCVSHAIARLFGDNPLRQRRLMPEFLQALARATQESREFEYFRHGIRRWIQSARPSRTVRSICHELLENSLPEADDWGGVVREAAFKLGDWEENATLCHLAWHARKALGWPMSESDPCAIHSHEADELDLPRGPLAKAWGSGLKGKAKKLRPFGQPAAFARVAELITRKGQGGDELAPLITHVLDHPNAGVGYLGQAVAVALEEPRRNLPEWIKLLSKWILEEPNVIGSAFYEALGLAVKSAKDGTMIRDAVFHLLPICPWSAITDDLVEATVIRLDAWARHRDSLVRHRALALLEKIYKNGRETKTLSGVLRSLSRSKSPWKRRDAARFIGRSGCVDLLSEVACLAKDQHQRVRIEARRSLGTLRASEHLALVLVGLDSSADETERYGAICACISMRDSGAIEALRPIAYEPEPRLAAAATDALALFEDFEGLARMLDESSFAYVLESIEIFHGLPEEFSCQPGLRRRYRKRLRQYCKRRCNARSRVAALSFLGRIGAGEDVPVITPCLYDEQDGVRIAATECYARLSPRKSLEYLLDDTNFLLNPTRIARVNILGRLIDADVELISTDQNRVVRSKLWGIVANSHCSLEERSAAARVLRNWVSRGDLVDAVLGDENAN